MIKFNKTFFIILLVTLLSGWGIFFYIGSKIVSNLSLIESSENFAPFKINFDSSKKKIYLFKNCVTLQNVNLWYIENNDNKEMSEKRDKENLVSVPSLEIYFNIFDVLKLLISNNIPSSITLKNPKILINSSITNEIYDEINKIYSSGGQKFKFNIKNGKIKYFQNNLLFNKEFDNINGDLKLSGREINSNLTILLNGLTYNLGLNFNNNMPAISIALNLSSKYDDLKLNGKFLFDDNKEIKDANGNLSINTNNINSLMNTVCFNCDTRTLDENLLDKNKSNMISLSGDVKYLSDQNLIKLDNINITNINNNDISLDVSYDLKQKKFINTIEFASLNLGNPDEVIASNSLNNKLKDMGDYFHLISRFNSLNNISIKQIDFVDYHINDLKALVEFHDSEVNINYINARFDEVYNIKINANVVTSDDGNFSSLDVVLGRGIDESVSVENLIFIAKAEIIKNLFSIKSFVINTDGIKASGDLLLKTYNEQNVLNGNVNVHDLKIDTFKNDPQIKKIFDRINFDQFNNIKNGGDFATKLIQMFYRFKLQTSLKINLDHMSMTQTIDDTGLIKNYSLDKMNFFVDFIDGKLHIITNANNEIFDKLDSDIVLMLKDFTPYISAKIKGNLLNIDNFKKILNIDNSNLFVSEDSFKDGNGAYGWKNFNINFSSLAAIDFDLDVHFNNVVFNDIKFTNMDAVINAESNVLKLQKFSFNFQNSSIFSNANIDVLNNFFNIKLTFDSFPLISFMKLFKKDIVPDYDIWQEIFSATLDLNTNGRNFYEALDRVAMNGKYLMRNFIVNKLDLNNFIQNYSDAMNESQLISLSEQSVITGRTIFESIEGAIEGKNGIVNTDLSTFNSRFNTIGTFNCVLSNLSFKGLTKIAFFSTGKRDANFVNLEWIGNLFNVNKNFISEKVPKQKTFEK